MMKRISALILVLALCLSLAACGGSVLPTPAKTEAPATEPAKTDAPVTEPPKTDAPTTEAPATEAPTTEAPTTEAPVTEAPTEPDDTLSVRGTTDGNAYTNEYLGLEIALPDGWAFYTEEQMAQINNTTAELFAESDIADLIAQSGQATDMMMYNLSGSSANLIIQPKQAILAAYPDETIFQLSEETIKSQMASAGMNIETYEILTMQMNGEDHTVLHMGVDASGMKLEEYQAWYRGAEDYMGILTLALMDDSDPQSFFDGVTVSK